VIGRQTLEVYDVQRSAMFTNEVDNAYSADREHAALYGAVPILLRQSAAAEFRPPLELYAGGSESSHDEVALGHPLEVIETHHSIAASLLRDRVVQ
jgi:hypothetical protein